MVDQMVLINLVKSGPGHTVSPLDHFQLIGTPSGELLGQFVMSIWPTMQMRSWSCGMKDHMGLKI